MCTSVVNASTTGQRKGISSINGSINICQRCYEIDGNKNYPNLFTGSEMPANDIFAQS